MRQDFCSRLYRAVVLPVLLALAVLGGFGGPESAAQEDKIVLAFNLDQNTMDPHMHFQRVGILMNIQMYDSLLHKTPKLEYEPSLATSWRAIDDTTWEFKLRQGVKFHNGDPFTAEDVKFTFERVLDPATKSPQYGNIRAIKEVKIIDAHTVHLITDKPFPLLIERVVFFPIIPKQHYEKVGAQAFGDSAPVGTGPYKFAEWKRDQFLRLERFDEHWRGKAPIKTLIIRVIPETSTQIAELKTGGVDIIRNLSPDLIPDLKAHANTYVSTAPILRTHYVSLDMREAPFTKKEARQAANYAIDRQTIVDKLMGGLGGTVPTVINPAAFGYDPKVEGYSYDPKKAKELLKQAGYPNGVDSPCIPARRRRLTASSPRPLPRCSPRSGYAPTSRSGTRARPGTSFFRPRAKPPTASSAPGATTRRSMPMPSCILSTIPSPVAGWASGIPGCRDWMSSSMPDAPRWTKRRGWRPMPSYNA